MNTNENNFKIVTWNVAGDPSWLCKYNKLDIFSIRLPKIIREITTYFSDCHMILFNEVFLGCDQIVNGLRHLYPHYTYLGRKNCLRYLTSGLLVMSKLPLKVHQEYFDHVGGLDIFTSKGFIAVEVVNPLNNKTYTVIDTHLNQNNGQSWDVWDNYALRSQIKQIAKYVNGLADKSPDNKIVMCGDYNLSPEDKIIGRRKYYDSLVELGGFDEIPSSDSTQLVRCLTKNTNNTNYRYAYSRLDSDLSDTVYLQINLND